MAYSALHDSKPAIGGKVAGTYNGKERIDVGFLRGTFRVIGDVISLGGTARLRHWTNNQRELLKCYQDARANIEIENIALRSAVVELKRGVATATRLLRRAGKMLDPLGQGRRVRASGAMLSAKGASASALARSGAPEGTTSKELAITAGGLGVGIGTAGGGWVVAQALGHASTGIPMAALHGAAAANAGWAWFGGGSLAAGGGGMALGQIILPGIGTLAAVTFSSVLSHREANKVAEKCKALEVVNTANQRILVNLKTSASKVSTWDRRLKKEHKLLESAVEESRAQLFPLGFISRFLRWSRVWFGGTYYLADEQYLVDRLDSTVTRFLDAFRNL